MDTPFTTASESTEKNQMTCWNKFTIHFLPTESERLPFFMQKPLYDQKSYTQNLSNRKNAAVAFLQTTLVTKLYTKFNQTFV